MAVLDVYPVAERFFQEFAVRQVMLNAAKNGSGPSAAGTSGEAGGPDTAGDAPTTERARNELDTLGQVIKINLTRAVLDAAPEIADLSTLMSETLPPALGLASDAARLFADELATIGRLAAALRDMDLPGIFDALTWSPYRDLLLDQLGLGGGPTAGTGEWDWEFSTGSLGASPDPARPGRKPPLTAAQLSLPPVTTTGAPAPYSFRAAQGGVPSAAEQAAIHAEGAWLAQQERARKAEEALRQAIGGRASAAQNAAREAERAAQEEARAREEAVREIEQIRDAYLSATGQQIALIERRRDRELAALADLKLSEQELAEARTKIAATAAAEIAEINKRAAEESEREWDDFGRGWTASTSCSPPTARRCRR